MPDHRIELPDGLSPREEAAALAALEQYFAAEQVPPSSWALAGRTDASGMGAVQVRRLTSSGWRAGIRMPFARRGAPPLHGRGDAK
jgi:hypothetical protein